MDEMTNVTETAEATTPEITDIPTVDSVDDGSVALGVAIIAGAGAVIGIGAKTAYDKIKAYAKTKKAVDKSEKKPGIFARFKKEAEKEPEIVAEGDFEEIESEEESKTEKK